MWKSKQIAIMWNRILKPQIYEKWSKIEVLDAKLEKIGFHEQACMRIINLAYAAKIMCMWVLA